jgi:hypothetical protein
VDLKMPVDGRVSELYRRCLIPRKTVVAVLTTSMHAADTCVAQYADVEYLAKLTEERMEQAAGKAVR